MKKDKLQFNRNNEDKFVKMLRSYNEAITGDNAKPHDFIPSDVEDIEANAADTEMRSDDDDRDQAIKRAEEFIDMLYDKCGELVVQMVEEFKAESPMNDDGLDIVLEFNGDASNNQDLELYGFSNFVWSIMMHAGKTADRGGEGDEVDEIWAKGLKTISRGKV